MVKIFGRNIGVPEPSEKPEKKVKDSTTMPLSAGKKIDVKTTPQEGIPKGTADKVEFTRRERSTKGANKEIAGKVTERSAAFKNMKVIDDYSHNTDEKRLDAIGKLTKALPKYGYDEEGILRVAGNQKNADAIKSNVYSNATPNIEQFEPDVHDVARALKATFKEVAFSPDVKQGLLECFKKDGKPDLEKVVQLNWTPTQRQILDEVLAYTSEVAKHAEKNLMTAENIATILAATFVKTSDDAMTMVEDNKQITAVLKAVIESGIKFSR